MSTIPVLRTALSALVGSRVTKIDRIVNIVRLGFDKDGEIHRMHVQCSFRAARADVIMVGTTDLETLFDRNAKMLTDILQAGEFHVTGTEMADSGSFVISVSDAIRLQGIPTCSGPMEAWRLFQVSGPHHVYPESSLYDDYPNYTEWP